MVQYFIYALEQETADPLLFLAEPVDPSRRAKLFAMTRHLWCTAVFVTLAGQGIGFDPQTGAQFVKLASDPATARTPGLLFGFEKVQLSITDDGVVRYGPAPTAKEVHRFKVLDPVRYGPGMTAATAAMLKRFPVR